MTTTPQPLFDMSKAQPIATPSAPLFNMSKAVPLDEKSTPAGPTIGPSSQYMTPRTPFDAVLRSAVDKLKEAANFTEEGRAEHPIQAKLGDLANRLEGFFFGTSHGEAAIGSGKYGMLTHPITSALMPGAGGAPAAAQLVEDVGAGVEAIPKLMRRAYSGSGAEAVGRAAMQTVAPELAEAPISATRSASAAGAATSITQREVLEHADDLGINLTPAQALKTPLARTEQTFGEQALLTGGKISEAVAKEKTKLDSAVAAFQDVLDPQRVGMSSEAAGEHLQNSAEIARSVLKENVNHAYDLVREQQADLAADVQTPLKNFIESETVARQPHAAVARPVFKTAAARAALDDISSMLDDPALESRASVESLRNLRTTLMEKGNDYSANALADSGQRIYKLAASKVDSAITQAAEGTPFREAFDAAGQANSKLQELYNTRGSPLYRILNTDDPAAVTDGILTRSSVHEIEALKGENFDLGPLARQAVEDIKVNGYKVTSSGLGGYPDTFLRSLLGPDATRELYLKSAIARDLAENYNPSGSGKVALGASQLLHPVAAAAAQAARLRSMPKAAAEYLPEIAGAVSPVTGGALARPDELFRRANP